mgnify:CR=1 FL=1
MSVLSDAIRRQIWRGMMRNMSGERESASFSKVELQDAIDAADTWLDL